MEQEKASLLQRIHEIEEQHKETVSKLQRHVQEKEKLLAAEFAEAEQVYKTTEHDLRERLEEKTQIIEVISNKFIPLFLTEKMLPFEKFNNIFCLFVFKPTWLACDLKLQPIKSHNFSWQAWDAGRLKKTCQFVTTMKMKFDQILDAGSLRHPA